MPAGREMPCIPFSYFFAQVSESQPGQCPFFFQTERYKRYTAPAIITTIKAISTNPISTSKNFYPNPINFPPWYITNATTHASAI